jgi:hypothetical protein
MWFSGFFGLAALAHLVRLVTRIHLTIGDHVFRLRYSLIVVVVAGIASLLLAKSGCGKCNCAKK